jgi:hypothetical protein
MPARGGVRRHYFASGRCAARFGVLAPLLRSAAKGGENARSIYERSRFRAAAIPNLPAPSRLPRDRQHLPSRNRWGAVTGRRQRAEVPNFCKSLRFFSAVAVWISLRRRRVRSRSSGIGRVDGFRLVNTRPALARLRALEQEAGAGYSGFGLQEFRQIQRLNLESRFPQARRRCRECIGHQHRAADP